MYADRIDVSRLDNRERYLSVVKAAHLFAPELAQKISEELILTRTTEGSSMFKDTAIYFNWDVFADVTFSVEVWLHISFDTRVKSLIDTSTLGPHN